MEETVLSPQEIAGKYLNENKSDDQLLGNLYGYPEFKEVIAQIRAGSFSLAVQNLEFFLKKHLYLYGAQLRDFYFFLGLAHLGNNDVNAATDAFIRSRELGNNEAEKILSDVYPDKAVRFFAYANTFIKNRKSYNALVFMLAAALLNHEEAKKQLEIKGITFEQNNADDNKNVTSLNFSKEVSAAVRYKVLQYLYIKEWITADLYVKNLEALEAGTDSKLAGKIQRQILLNKTSVNCSDNEIKNFIQNTNAFLTGAAKEAFGKLEEKFNDSRISANYFPEDALQAAELAVFTPSGAMFSAGWACMALDVLGILPALACWVVAIGLGVLGATVGQIAVPFLKKYFENRHNESAVIAERTKAINEAHVKLVKTEVKRVQAKHATFFPRKDYNSEKRLPGISFFRPAVASASAGSPSVSTANNLEFGMK